MANWRMIVHDEGPQADKARANIEKMPELTEYEELFWLSFLELTTERPPGMSETPIPISAITEYAANNDFDYNQTLILHRVMRAMDAAWMRASSEKRERQNAR